MKNCGWSFTSSAILCFCLTSFISGCASVSSRVEKAQAIAANGYMQVLDIATKSFVIRSYERIDNPQQKTVRVYIEGDGLAWLDRSTPSLDPTPSDPLALSLAAIDPSANVIYLARPCQYLRAENKSCHEKYWTSEIFAPVIINTMSEALDAIKTHYGFTKIELIGYSGGAAVALLVAAQRNDILTIRTVAGNLDTDAFAKLHQLAVSKRSQNPANIAASLSGIPQMHFIGGNDVVVPQLIYQDYVQRLADTHCVNSRVISSVSHENGWTNIWPTILTEVPTCRNKSN